MKAEPPESEKTKSVKVVLISSICGVLGTIITLIGNGFIQGKSQTSKQMAEQQLETGKEQAEQNLERQKFDAELIKEALQAPTSDDRLKFLSFMVETHLIQDEKVREGVRGYVDNTGRNNQKVPQYFANSAT